ncbi:MAG: hypothetical protein GX601_12430, partial [Anaerolineales bacterium]|nr:hypothetical protein [Anaerolineales bacterium]
MKRTLYIVVSLLALVGMLLVACQAPEPVVVTQIVQETVVVEGEEVEVPVTVQVTAAPEEEAPTAEVELTMESPMLAERVAAGELPPLEERLPLKPLVVKDGMISMAGAIPDLTLGQYGGTFRTAHQAGGLDVELFYTSVEPVVTGPDITLENLYGNVFEAYEVSEDNTEFTFKLREGLKWSDGVPVTMDDVRFVIEDLYFNEEYGTVPGWLLSSDEANTPAEFEVVDDWTFRLKFQTPYGSLIKYLALTGWNSWHTLVLPKHYLQQWHPTYTDLADALEEANLAPEEWPTLFNQMNCGNFQLGLIAEKCIAQPQLSPMIMTAVSSEGANFERNPYYFKVDEAGRQLPYWDTWTSVRTADIEAANLLALNGDLDSYWQLDLLKAAMAMEMGKEKGYDLVLNLYLHADGNTFFFNGCTNDPVVRALFNDVRFRQACNYAMNRQEINDNVFLGFASLPENIQDSEYSQEKANALLDEIGMTERDANGFRLSPDGQPVSILIEYPASGAMYGLVKATELFAAQLQEVGINAEPRATDDAVLNERAVSHDVQIGGWETYIG